MEKKLSNAKIIGGIGSILLLLAVIPDIEIIGLIGFVLLLIALNTMSTIFNDNRIFKNALISFILMVVGVGISLVITIVAGVSLFSIFGSSPFSLMDIGAVQGNIFLTAVLAILGFYIPLIFSAHYLKKTMYLLFDHTEIKLFKIGGLLYFIGTILLILVVGVLINVVAWVLIAVGFFTMPDDVAQRASAERS